VPVHVAGIVGLCVIFALGTLRPINLGVLALVMTFVVGTIAAREAPAEMYRGFPADLFVLLTGVTYLFAVAERNGTVAWIVEGSARLAGNRRRVLPWVIFSVAAAPAMAGAIGSAGVALLAPMSMRLAERCALDRRMVGLMVGHGAAAGNFSPLNVLGAIVHQALASRDLAISAWALFATNLAYNVVLGAIVVAIFGRVPSPGRKEEDEEEDEDHASPGTMDVDPGRAVGVLVTSRASLEQGCTLSAIVGVAIASLGFGLSIGFTALAAGAALQLAFPRTSVDAERRIAWPVVLLVCGVVTYVSALQRYGTVDAIGTSIASLASPSIVALLLCGMGALTSAFASSAGILGALVPLAAPFLVQGGIPTTEFIIALAISATVVDATPFSTVGALVVAHASEWERARVYRALLAWGMAMVVSAPLVTWLVFIVPSAFSLMP
jgi:di/tricarboxylate transporter